MAYAKLVLSSISTSFQPTFSQPVETSSCAILTSCGKFEKQSNYPVGCELGPYFSAMGQIAIKSVAGGADALVLFNRFYQPDIDSRRATGLLNDLQLSRAKRGGGLLWIAVLWGHWNLACRDCTGVEDSEQVLKYLLAADVVMVIRRCCETVLGTSKAC